MGIEGYCIPGSRVYDFLSVCPAPFCLEGSYRAKQDRLAKSLRALQGAGAEPVWS